jgi:cytochrome c biogenesis protein CcmG, thiol:disulfide interchange protein DsbE
LKKIFLSFALAGACVAPAQAQTAPAVAAAGTNKLVSRPLPAVTVRTLDGQAVSAATIAAGSGGKPTIVSFWATWCKPCIAELTNIAEEYADWQKESGVRLVAISIDDARNAAKVAPLVRGKGWEYAVYIDQNQDLKRALNVNNVPHTFLLNGAGEIVWQHNAYQEGDEAHLRELVKQVAAGQPITE